MMISLRSHSGSTHLEYCVTIYTSFKHKHTFEDYLSGMANCQLRKTLSRFGCGSHWLRCATRFMSQNPDEQFCPACLEGRVCGEHETEHHAIFVCDAFYHIKRSRKFRPLFADMLTESLHAFFESNDYTLIAKFLLQCRRERTKIVRYNNFDIRT